MVFYTIKMHPERILALVLLIVELVNGQNNPCPDLLEIKPTQVEFDRWDGTIKLRKNVDLAGVWLRVIFDRPIVQLGNWFGEVNTTDFQSFLVKNPDFKLKANVPALVEFFVKYDVGEPVPSIEEFRLNAEVQCGFSSRTTPLSNQLRTSHTRATTPRTGSVFDNQPAISNSLLEPKPLELQRPEEEIECGTVANLVTPLITQAQPTYHGEFPWHAALYYSKVTSIEYICGGSLISKWYVVTAAHCVYRDNTRGVVDAKKLLVQLGKYFLNRFDTAGHQERGIDKIEINPWFNLKNYTHDIALLRFETPIQYSDYVRPICLWEGPRDFERIVNQRGTIAGWGFDDSGQLSRTLMKSSMPIKSKLECIYTYPNFYSLYISPYSYCAGFANGTSACNGDSGGGMVMLKSNRQAWQLRGIVSISVALSFKCDPNYYSVFTDAAQYVDWINSFVRQDND